MPVAVKPIRVRFRLNNACSRAMSTIRVTTQPRIIREYASTMKAT